MPMLATDIALLIIILAANIAVPEIQPPAAKPAGQQTLVLQPLPLHVLRIIQIIISISFQAQHGAKIMLQQTQEPEIPIAYIMIPQQ